MANLEQPTAQETTEQFLDRMNGILKLPEGSLEELQAKETACNKAIFELNERIRYHHESGDNSLDDNSQEETADSRSRSLIAEALRAFHEKLAYLGNEIAQQKEQK